MKKSKKTALMLAVMGLGIYSPIADNSLGTYFEANTAEAAVVSSIGEISAFAKDSDPSGYLLCDGREVSRADYPELFAAIGTKYGAGDGKTTFNLPNLIDRFVEGSTEAGVHKEAGLPNITGGVPIDDSQLEAASARSNSYGAFYPSSQYVTHDNNNGNGEVYGSSMALDASRSNPVYGKSDTVQPEALTMRYFIKATSRIQEDITVDKNFTAYGHTDLRGDVRVEDGLEVKGDTQLGDNKDEDKVDVWAKTHLHGDTTIGDSDKDKLVVNAESEFKADATFDKDVRVKGNLETDGNATTHGNQTVDGDLTVKGNTTLGDDKTKDAVDINAKANLHGDTTIGDSADDKLTVNATSEFKADADFDKDVHIKGNAEVDKNMTVHGDTILDGKFFAAGAAQFGDDLNVAKNLTVGGNALVKQHLGVEGNTYIGGDALVEGDIYGRSFNVGNERYIDKNGINANNHKIRNVADGEIGPNSLDAVNGRQLWNAREGLQHNVNQIGAQTAAMANLHPMDFEYGDKFSVAAAVGGYQNQQAFALGAFVKPTQKSMFSLTGTLGMSQNMYGMGYTQKFGKKADFEHMTENQLYDELAKLTKDAEEIREHDKQIKEENETLRKASRMLAESIDVNSAEIGRLKAIGEQTRTENMVLRDENKALKDEIFILKEKDVSQENKIAALNAKVDSMMAELGRLGATGQK